jgi:hypothetical protein
MRGIAMATGAPGAFTVGGTMTVIGLGLVSGVAGGLIHQVLHVLMSRRPVLRDIVFAAILALLLWRGLSPVTVVGLTWLGPVMVLFGAAYLIVHHRRSAASSPASPDPTP